MNSSSDRPRPEEYPDQTRAAVIAAARRVRRERLHQTVEQIAKLGGCLQRRCTRSAAASTVCCSRSWTAGRRLPTSTSPTRSHSPPTTPPLVMRTLSTAYLQITKQWGDVIRTVIDVAPHDDESAACSPPLLALATTAISRRSAAISRTSARCATSVDARLARQIITYYYGIDGLLGPAMCSAGRWSARTSGCWLIPAPRSCAAAGPRGSRPPEAAHERPRLVRHLGDPQVEHRAGQRERRGPADSVADLQPGQHRVERIAHGRVEVGLKPR